LFDNIASLRRLELWVVRSNPASFYETTGTAKIITMQVVAGELTSNLFQIRWYILKPKIPVWVSFGEP
jgi:hypothetical protein